MTKDKQDRLGRKKSSRTRGNGLTPRKISPKVRESNQRRKNDDRFSLEL